MKKLAVVFAAAVVTLMSAQSAFAGLKSTYNVQVDTTNRYALGAVGDAYNSSDNVQYIACTIQAQTGAALQGSCIARTAANVIGSCATSDPNMIAAMSGINADSYVLFEWTANGVCSYLHVDHGSLTAPKR